MKKQLLFFMVLTLISCGANAQARNKNISVAGFNPSQILDNSPYQKSITSICDTIFSFKTRTFPTGLTWDGTNLWYVDSSYIYKVSTTGIHLDSIANPALYSLYRGGDLTYDGINLWYADEQTAQLFKLNPATGNTIQQFTLPSVGHNDPNGFGLAWDGTYIWHSQYAPPRIYKLDPTNGNVLNSLTTAKGILGIEWINGKLFGIGTGVPKLFKINTSTGVFQDSAMWCVQLALGLTWDGSTIWNVSGTITWGGEQRIYKLNSDFILSVNELINRRTIIEIFPNPFTFQTNITFSEEQKNTTIKITDILGQEIKTINFTGRQLVIDKGEMKAGIYFVQTIDEKKNDTNKKIIVQ